MSEGRRGEILAVRIDPVAAPRIDDVDRGGGWGDAGPPDDGRARLGGSATQRPLTPEYQTERSEVIDLRTCEGAPPADEPEGGARLGKVVRWKTVCVVVVVVEPGLLDLVANGADRPLLPCMDNGVRRKPAC